MVSCRCAEGTKNAYTRISLYTKAQEVTSPILPHHAPFPIAIFGVWGQVANLINHANLYINRCKGLCPHPEGSKFALLHWLDVSPLQQCKHYRATLWKGNRLLHITVIMWHRIQNVVYFVTWSKLPLNLDYSKNNLKIYGVWQWRPLVSRDRASGGVAEKF